MSGHIATDSASPKAALNAGVGSACTGLQDLTGPSAQVPSWITGSRECQVGIADNISIFKENHKVILRLCDSKGADGNPKNVVEFEVDPSALSASLAEEREALKMLLPNFTEKGLVKSELFRRLSSDQGELFKIKRLNVADRFVEINAVLAEGAVVSGNLADSVLSLRGSGAHFQNLNISGASVVALQCEDSSISNFAMDRTSVLMGNLSGLSRGTDASRIEAHAVGLMVDRVGSNTSPELLREMFLGSRLSKDSFDLSLLGNSAKQLSIGDLLKDEEALNQQFTSNHFGNLQTLVDGSVPVPALFTNVGIHNVRASRVQENSLQIELPLQSPIKTENGAMVRAVILEMPKALDSVTPTAALAPSTPRIDLRVSTEIEGGKQVTGDVEVKELAPSRLLHLWALRALYLAKGRVLSDQELVAFAACAHDQMVEVAGRLT